MPDPEGRWTLITGGTVVTMNAAQDVVQADALVSPVGTIMELYQPGMTVPRIDARVVDATGCFVVPGLVQAHIHLCQTLFRGLAEERPLLAWLKERIWPLEAAHDATSLRASARLGISE